jgi:HD-GYP domain-containing protein (c-di-GMP phosphodiesterase class II)
MLKHIDYLQAALEIPYGHHEKWDGTGYPRGLKGEEIPISARLFAIVDVYDALVSDRPYRKALPPQEVIDYLKSQSGSHFDPNVVDLFLRVFTLT